MRNFREEDPSDQISDQIINELEGKRNVVPKKGLASKFVDMKIIGNKQVPGQERGINYSLLYKQYAEAEGDIWGNVSNFEEWYNEEIKNSRRKAA